MTALGRKKINTHLTFFIFKTRGGFRGGGGAEAAAAPPPPFSSSEIFFLSKYTIILSFCKQSVGAFDFFS